MPACAGMDGTRRRCVSQRRGLQGRTAPPTGAAQRPVLPTAPQAWGYTRDRAPSRRCRDRRRRHRRLLGGAASSAAGLKRLPHGKGRAGIAGERRQFRRRASTGTAFRRVAPGATLTRGLGPVARAHRHRLRVLPVGAHQARAQRCGSRRSGALRRRRCEVRSRVANDGPSARTRRASVARRERYRRFAGGRRRPRQSAPGRAGLRARRSRSRR